MASFVVIPQSQVDVRALDELLKARFENSAYRLPRGEWLVSYEGTTKQLSDDLGISSGEVANAVVLNFSGYFGRAGADLWEWMSVKVVE